MRKKRKRLFENITVVRCKKKVCNNNILKRAKNHGYFTKTIVRQNVQKWSILRLSLKVQKNAKHDSKTTSKLFYAKTT